MRADRGEPPVAQSGSRQSRIFLNDAPIALRRTHEGGCWLWRIQQSFRQKALVLDRQANDLGVLDRAVCGSLGRSDHEIAHAAPLDLGRPLDDGERVGRNAGLDAGRTVGSWGIMIPL
jgi:hypothetical protein